MSDEDAETADVRENGAGTESENQHNDMTNEEERLGPNYLTNLDFMKTERTLYKLREQKELTDIEKEILEEAESIVSRYS